MLQLKESQMKAFEEAQVARANQALVVYARKRFPDRFVQSDDAQMLVLVQANRERARGFGIEKENDVATFLDLTVMYGENFPKDPWAQDVLTTKALYGPDKMALLRHRVRETGVEL